MILVESAKLPDNCHQCLHVHIFFSTFLIEILQMKSEFSRNFHRIPVEKADDFSLYIVGRGIDSWFLVSSVFFFILPLFFFFQFFFLLLGIEFIRQKGVIFYVRLCGGKLGYFLQTSDDFRCIHFFSDILKSE